MSLVPYDDLLPEDFHRHITHLWLLTEKGKVEVVKKYRGDDYDGEEEAGCSIHAQQWGEEAFENPQRGYFAKDLNIVQCHGHADRQLIAKLARKFKEAIYISH